MDPIGVVKLFAERICAQDPDGLADLMTDDHRFTDGMGTIDQGRERMREGWKGYFAMVPDYWIRIDRIMNEGEIVLAVGLAGGTYTTDGSLKPENYWEVPAAWYALVRENKVAEWRVYVDNEPIRQIMEREDKANDSD